MKKDTTRETQSTPAENHGQWEDYWKNRTLHEIMEDYDDQRDEWEMQLVMKEGQVTYQGDPLAPATHPI